MRDAPAHALGPHARSGLRRALRGGEGGRLRELGGGGCGLELLEGTDAIDADRIVGGGR